MTKLRRTRKNFFPTLLVTLFLWGAWGVVFFFVPPETFLAPIGFLFLTFTAILFTASLLFANTRRGGLAATGVVAFMILNYFGVGNYLNLILLIGILITAEYYFSR